MNPRGAPPVVRVKQGDGFSRFLQAQLTKDGVNFTPESGVDFIFRCIKPDGHGVLEDSINEDAELERYLVINQGNGVIQIELVDQVATAVGRCMCDLCLIKSEKILSTIPFVIEVVASPDVGSTFRDVSGRSCRGRQRFVCRRAAIVQPLRLRCAVSA